MKNILVINVNWIGDVVFSSPIFKALKESYPDAKISCMAHPRVKDILGSIPYVDETIIYEEKGMHKSILGKIKLIKGLKKRNFDIAFILHKSLTRAFMVFLAGIPVRVGYNTKNRGIFLTNRIEDSKGMHRSDYYLNIIEAYGIKIKDRTNTLQVNNKIIIETSAILEENKINPDDFVIVIHAGANWDLKRWPEKNFGLLSNAILMEKNAKILLTGAESDASIAKEISSYILGKDEGNLIFLTGKTSLKQLIGLLYRADLFISADSGPLHVANSLGTDVIGLFGPTRPEITGPRGSGKVIILQHDVSCNKEPCYYLKCPDNICMKSITVEEVEEAINPLIKK